LAPGWGLNGSIGFAGEGFAPTSRVSALSYDGLSSLSRFERGSAPDVESDETVTKGKSSMALYEHVFLTRQDATNAQIDALTEQYKGVISAGGGKVAKTEYWGVKSIAFRIKKNRKAHYTLMNIDAPPAAVAEMERQMSISEDVIRFMTVRVEELEEGPSAQMRRRDDREERGGFGDDRGFGFGGGGFGGVGGRGGFGGGGGGRGRRDDRGDRGEAAPEAN
jgi:small subunit ribosomal protein S6